MDIAKCELYVLGVLVASGEFRRFGLKNFMVEGREQTGVFIRAWGPKLYGHQAVFDLKLPGDSFTEADVDAAIDAGFEQFRRG